MPLSKIVYTKEDKTSRMNYLLTNNPTGELIKVIYEKFKACQRLQRIRR